MRSTPKTLWLLGSVLFLVPMTARANAGTPLMWASMLHLVFGNLLLGALEGLFLGWLFRLRKRSCVLPMILANYFSAWLGGRFILPLISQSLAVDVTNIRSGFWGMVVIAWALTLVLEWPFVAWCFRKSERRLVRSWWGNLATQSASYTLLFGWFWMASATSLITEGQVVPLADLRPPTALRVLYISPADGDVYERDVPGGDARRVQKLGTTNRYNRLFLQRSSSETNRWDLWTFEETSPAGEHEPKPKLLQASFVGTNEFPWAGPDEPLSKSWFMNDGQAGQLGSAANSEWRFSSGFWPAEGISAYHKTDQKPWYLALETPFFAWHVRSATQLPGDFVVFQMGEDQICLLDFLTKRLALLARGRGPVALLK